MALVVRYSTRHQNAAFDQEHVTSREQRRAAQLQGELARESAQLNLTSTAVIKVNEAANPESVLKTAVQDFEVKLRQAKNLIKIQYAIRESVATANTATGVAELLSQDAGAKAQMTLIAEILAQRDVCPTTAEWVSTYNITVERMKKAESLYGHTDQINISVLGTDARERLTKTLADLRRVRNNVSDRLLAINTNTYIDITDTDWTVLQNLGLV